MATRQCRTFGVFILRVILMIKKSPGSVYFRFSERSRLRLGLRMFKLCLQCKPFIILYLNNSAPSFSLTLLCFVCLFVCFLSCFV